MALYCTGASAQYLQNSAPLVLDYPLTVACWFNPATVTTSTRTIWALSDTGTTNHYLALQLPSLNFINAVAAAGGTEVFAANANSVVAGSWYFVVARFISATNRRISALERTGLVSAGVNTTSRAPTSLDTMTLGARVSSNGATMPFDGAIAEFWIANSDVGVDSAAALPADLVRRLAYNGPFSDAYVVPRIVEYRSFRTDPLAGTGNDFYYSKDVPVWSNVNGATMSAHPPLLAAPYSSRLYPAVSIVTV